MSVAPSKQSPPLVTVLLPVLNGEDWIEQTIESLKRQSLTDFEVLAIDDHCRDRSIDILRNSGIPNLRVLRGPGTGLAHALALGVAEARADLVARQDADDLSLPDRLEVQHEFMTLHPDFVAYGSPAIEIDAAGNRIGLMAVPSSDAAIRLRLTLLNPFIHSSVMFRRSAVLAAGNYRSPSSQAFPEDFDLWSRLSERGKLGNCATPLIAYRRTSTSLTATRQDELGRGAAAVAAANLALALGRPLSERETDLIATFHRRSEVNGIDDAARLLRLLIQVRRLHPARTPHAWGPAVWAQPLKLALHFRRWGRSTRAEVD